MDAYTFWSLITSTIAAIILTSLTLHWIYMVYCIKYCTQKLTKNIANKTDSHTSDNISSKITNTITISLVFFTLLAYVHVIIFGFHSTSKHQNEMFRKRTLYVLPLRIIPLTFMYVFFFERLKGIFGGSIYSINKPIYKYFFIFSLVLYNILLILIEIVIVLTVELDNMLLYGNSIILILCIIGTTIEITLSVFLVFAALKRLNALNRITVELRDMEGNTRPVSGTVVVSRNKRDNVLKTAALKIFLCTMLAAISTQILLLWWAIETRFYITQPPISRTNVDLIVNSFCIVLSVHYYDRQYKILCFPCMFCVES